MKKLIAVVACAVLCAGTAFSQNYKHAVGVRLGVETAGLTYKHQLNSGNAIDGMLAFGYRGSQFTLRGLYEWTMPVINDDFNFYYGVGGHLGAAYSRFAIGVDAIVGLEYCIPGVPLALSLDYKPFVNFVTPRINGLWDFGLGIKFTF